VKILNYGSLNIDLVYRVPHIVSPGETISSQSFLTFAGGKGANQSVAIARAGGKVYHAGKVGRDGQWLVKKIAGYGVNTRFIRTTTGNTTGQAVIQVAGNGENAIFLHPGANQQVTRKEIDNVLHNFQAGDALLLQNEINEVAYLIHAAHERQLLVCLNPAPMDRQVEKYPLRKVKMLILNETEGATLAGKTEPEAILNSLAEKMPESEIVLTLGKQGATARLPGRIIKGLPFRVKAVDTTAAGDTFIGYYLAGRSTGKDPADCLRLACAAAAVCVTRPGAMDSIPSIGQVMSFTSRK